MSFGRKVGRRTSRAYAQMIAKGETTTNEEGQKLHVLGSSQVEVLAALKALPVPPAAPGSEDTDRDEIDPVDYRRLMNARKRARRASRKS